MALSEHEQKLLAEMERNLMAEDASFAKSVSAVGSTSKNAGKLVAGVLVMLMGIGLLITAVVLQVAFFGVAAFTVMVIGLVMASSNFTAPKLPKGVQAPKANFFEDRWNQRFGNE